MHQITHLLDSQSPLTDLCTEYVTEFGIKLGLASSSDYVRGTDDACCNTLLFGQFADCHFRSEASTCGQKGRRMSYHFYSATI
jgi:hypothetical protein